MWLRGLSLLCFFVAGILLADCKPYDPMVAFVCSKGAMHMDPEKGWHADRHIDCVETKQQILDYCKRVYPLLDVQNIVETTEEMVIKGWCPLGDPHCSQPDTFRVRPYRCLTGPYQGDTLVVPNSCQFSYLHFNDTCTGPDRWKEMASTHCLTQFNMLLEDFGMLAPCGVDEFTGVDFVCCPPGVSHSDSTTPSVPLQPKINVKIGFASEPSSKGMQSSSAVDKYMHLKMVDGVYENEHEAYELARKEEEAAENEEKILQLDAVHQQHVQTNLNTKKRLSMQRLSSELRAEVYNVDRISHQLQQYIGAEQRDAQHCLRHYMKVRGHDLRAARGLLNATIEHITLISLRINQSINLLDTIKEERVKVKVKTSIRKWLVESYPPLSHTIDQLIEYKSEENSFMPTEPIEAVTEAIESAQDKNNMYKHFADKLSKTTFVLGNGGSSDGVESDREPQKLRKEIVEKKKTTVRSIGKNEYDVWILIVVAAVLLLLLIPAACCCYIRKTNTRRRRGHRRLKNTYLEVSEQTAKLSPEDRHIAAMQSGYENPTYKFLEERKFIEC